MTRAPTASDLGFALGPRINAGGRVGRADLGVRLGLYRRIGALASDSESEAMAAELVDRFGKMPAEVDGFAVVELRHTRNIGDNRFNVYFADGHAPAASLVIMVALAVHGLAQGWANQLKTEAALASSITAVTVARARPWRRWWVNARPSTRWTSPARTTTPAPPSRPRERCRPAPATGR